MQMENLSVNELEELIKKYEGKIGDAKNMIRRKNNEKINYVQNWFSGKIKFKITGCYYSHNYRKNLAGSVGSYYKVKHMVDNIEIVILIGSWPVKNTYCEIHKLENGEVCKTFHNYRNYPHLVEIYEYYNKEENIKKLFAQTDKIIQLCTETNYLNNLPKTYTFLLCNKKNNTFCRDISKIIAHKILFFLFVFSGFLVHKKQKRKNEK